MKKHYLTVVFLLCFFVWAVVVDNAVLPSMDGLQERTGSYSRYKVREWGKGGKLNPLKDELLVYVYVRNREQFFYIERTPLFEYTLKSLQPGTRVELGYVRRFPKLWKKELYELKLGRMPVIRYSPFQLKKKQAFIWKYTGIMTGVFILLASLGLINKPRTR